MVGGKAENPDTEEKKPDGKQADAGAQVQEGNLKAKTPKKGKPHCSWNKSWSEELADAPERLCSLKEVFSS